MQNVSSRTKLVEAIPNLIRRIALQCVHQALAYSPRKWGFTLTHHVGIPFQSRERVQVEKLPSRQWTVSTTDEKADVEWIKQTVHFLEVMDLPRGLPFRLNFEMEQYQVTVRLKVRNLPTIKTVLTLADVAAFSSTQPVDIIAIQSLKYGLVAKMSPEELKKIPSFLAASRPLSGYMDIINPQPTSH